VQFDSEVRFPLGSLSEGTYRLRVSLQNAGNQELDWSEFCFGVRACDYYDRGQSYCSFWPPTVARGEHLDIGCGVGNGGAAGGAFKVSFYASTNTTITSGDHFIGSVNMPAMAGGAVADCDWSGNLPSTVPPGTYYVGWIIDSDGQYAETNESNNVGYVSAFTLTVPNLKPSIGWFYGDPGIVMRPAVLTLEAGNITDADGTIAKVEFYRDDNNNSQVDVGVDQLLGTDTSSAGGWKCTTGTGSFPLGASRFLARAQDNDGAWSDAKSITVTVENAAPHIDSLSDSPDPVIRPNTLTLTANGVSDADGSISWVEFYHDKNSNGVLELGIDTYLGLDLDSAGGWKWSGSTASLPIGTNRYFARARDDDSDWSNVVSTTGTITEPTQPPAAVISSVTPSPADPRTDTVQFREASYDNDEGGATIQQWRWSSDKGNWQGNGTLSTQQEPNIPANDLAVNDLVSTIHTITLWVQDNEGQTDTTQPGDPAGQRPVALVVLNAIPTATMSGIPDDPVPAGSTITITLGGHDNDEHQQSVVKGELAVEYEPIVQIPAAQFGQYQLAVALSDGIYEVKWRVQDDEGAWSDWVTDYLDIVIETVSTPTSVTGPSNGFVGQSLSFTGGGAASNMGHAPEYQFDWGDGGPLSDWGPATQSKTYAGTGTFNIKARARCAAHHDAESPWSATLKTVAIDLCVLTITRDTPAGGQVQRDPAGTPLAGIPGSEYYGYSYSQQVKLTAVPNSGYRFDHWSGDAAGTNPIVWVTLNGNKAVTAHFTPENVKPTARIDSITPNPAQPPNDLIQFRGTGTDPNGEVVDWEWKSDLDGLIGSQDDFDKSSNDFTVNSAAGADHTITFRVRDDDGAWSDPATATLRVLNALPTAAPIGGIPSLPVEPGAQVTLTLGGHDNDENGQSITGGELKLDGVVVPDADMGQYELTAPADPGDYPVTWRVQDDEGTWSPAAQETLRVSAQQTGTDLVVTDLTHDPVAPKAGEEVVFSVEVENTDNVVAGPFAVAFWPDAEKFSGQLDQVQSEADYGFWFEKDVVRWQEFVPDQRLLKRIGLNLHRVGHPGDLWVAVDDGETGQRMWSQKAPESIAPTVGWADVDVDGVVLLVPGKKYRIVVWGDKARPDVDNSYYWRGQTDTDPYPKGENSVSHAWEGYDFGFRTYTVDMPGAADHVATVPSLAPGQKTTLTFAIDASQFVAGSHVACAFADFGDAIPELDEMNNISWHAWHLEAADKPDLVVIDLTLHSATSAPGGTISYTYTRKNAGAEGPAGNSTWDQMGFLSTDNTFDAQDIPLGTSYSVSTYHLSAGWTNTLSRTPVIPQDVPHGEYYLIVYEDVRPGQPPNNYPGVEESDETNNWRCSETKVVIGLATLTVESTPITGVEITGDKPGTTDYTPTCDDQEVVNLTAPATVTVGALRYDFVQWTGDGTPSGQDVQVTMGSDKTVVAEYALRQHTLIVQSTPITGVDITGDKPGTTDYTATCDDKEVVNLTAPATVTVGAQRYDFVQWTGDGSPAGQDVAVTMDDDKTVTAEYALRQHTLSVQSTPVAGISITGDRPGDTNYTASCEDNETVGLVDPGADADPPEYPIVNDREYVFVRWCVDGVDALRGEAFVEVTMDADHTVEACYSLRGDVTEDCAVNILDLIAIRNHLYEDVGTDDNWRYDLNDDGKINILDMVMVRNRLHSACK